MYNEWFLNRSAKVLNVPMDLLKDTKGNRGEQELLAFSLLIKMNYIHGAVNDLSINKIRQICYCSYNRAKRIYDRVKEDTKYFRYIPEQNRLETINLKKRYTKAGVNSHGFRIWQMYTFKIEIRDFTLAEMIRHFDEALFMNAINAVERRNKFQSVSDSIESTCERSSSASFDTLSQKQLAKVVGAKNRMTVYRITKRLERTHRLAVDRHELYMVTDCTSDAALAFDEITMPLIVDSDTGYGYWRLKNGYALTSDTVRKQFTNVILNHCRRCITCSVNEEYMRYVRKNNAKERKEAV